MILANTEMGSASVVDALLSGVAILGGVHEATNTAGSVPISVGHLHQWHSAGAGALPDHTVAIVDDMALYAGHDGSLGTRLRSPGKEGARPTAVLALTHGYRRGLSAELIATVQALAEGSVRQVQSLVNFDVAVGAEKLKSFGISFDLRQQFATYLPSPFNLSSRIDVMKVEGTHAPIVIADLASATERLHEPGLPCGMGLCLQV